MSHKGTSLIESLVVLMILGSMTALAVPAGMKMLSDYRMHIAVDQVSTALQLARAKAVNENFRMTVVCFPGSGMEPDELKLQGGEEDNGDGLNPWEDRNANGVKDVISLPSSVLPTGVRFLLATTTPAVPVTGNPGTTTTSIVFDPKGQPLLNGSNAVAIYVKNDTQLFGAVTLDPSGRIQRWKKEGSLWFAR